KSLVDLKCGENIYFSTVPVPWKNAIMSFYREGENLIYGKGSKDSSKAIGHYTQLVWHSSYLVGCAVSKCPRNRMKYMYVCQYCPGGNKGFRIHRPYNRGTPCASCPDSCDNGLCPNHCPYNQNKYGDCPSLAKGDGCQKEIGLMDDCPASCRCKNNEII
ncbi:hypothetical protein GDO86_010560, partial [Hymenochirus boettgeri]